MNAKERAHIGKVKLLPCGNCGEPKPSAAHHITEGSRRVGHFCVIPLCYSCHQGTGGIHGDKTLWKIMKNSELSVLADTMEKLTSENT